VLALVFGDSKQISVFGAWCSDPETPPPALRPHPTLSLHHWTSERSVGSLCGHPDCFRNVSDGSNWSQMGVGGVDKLGRTNWDQEGNRTGQRGGGETAGRSLRAKGGACYPFLTNEPPRSTLHSFERQLGLLLASDRRLDWSLNRN
jgi:hypothetical protein